MDHFVSTLIIDAHLGYFHILVTVNNDTTSMHV
jgi:hypothetical protein